MQEPAGYRGVVAEGTVAGSGRQERARDWLRGHRITEHLLWTDGLLEDGWAPLVAGRVYLGP